MAFKNYSTSLNSKAFLEKLSKFNYPYPLSYQTTKDGKPMLMHQTHARGTYTKKFVFDIAGENFKVTGKLNFFETVTVVLSVFLFFIFMLSLFFACLCK